MSDHDDDGYTPRRTTINVTIQLDSYVGSLYRSAITQLAEIDRDARIQYARTRRGREQRLEAYLRAHGMTLADYEELERDAQRHAGRLVVPPADIRKLLTETIAALPDDERPGTPDQIAAHVRPAGGWRTDIAVDHAHRRGHTIIKLWYVGANPPGGYRRTRPVHATGTLTADPTVVSTDWLERTIRWGGQHIGVGIDRRLGWGRFTVTRWAVTPATPSAERSTECTRP